MNTNRPETDKTPETAADPATGDTPETGERPVSPGAAEGSNPDAADSAPAPDYKAAIAKIRQPIHRPSRLEHMQKGAPGYMPRRVTPSHGQKTEPDKTHIQAHTLRGTHAPASPQKHASANHGAQTPERHPHAAPPAPDRPVFPHAHDRGTPDAPKDAAAEAETQTPVPEDDAGPAAETPETGAEQAETAIPPAENRKERPDPMSEPAGRADAGAADAAESEDNAGGDTPDEPPAVPRLRKGGWWRRGPLWMRIAAVVVGIPLVLLALLYARLLAGPIDLDFVRGNVEQAVRDSLPPNSAIELGDLSLSLSARLTPVLHFEPVTFTDRASGAEISVGAMEIGFSPLNALVGQPGAVVSLLQPRLQLLQDLLGPRLASFSETKDPETGETVVQIRQGEDVYPEVRIGADGLQVRGHTPQGDGIGLRSDNDWLIYNLEGMEHAIADLEAQAQRGQFARLEIHGGSMEMVDPVFDIARRFDDLDLVVRPGEGSKLTKGTLGATLAGQRISGTFGRQTGADGTSHLTFALENLDFASIMPMLDDPDGLMALKGVGKLDGALRFDSAGNVTEGQFGVDLANTEFRLRHDYFPVSEGHFSLDWNPKAARFALDDGRFAIGRSSTGVTGEIALGLDDVYGPMVAMSLDLTDLVLAPNDMKAPASPFTEVSVKAWSAPLYGTVGFDRVVAKKPGVEIRAKGRLDLIRHGIGVDLEVGGEGASADDLKRLWPYFIAQGGRKWFVSHVTAGRVKTGSLRIKLPVGSFDPDVEDKPLPPHTAWIDLVGSDVTVIPTDGFSPVALGGDATLKLRDNKTSVTLGKTQFVGDKGLFTVSDGAVQIDAGEPGQTVIEFSGDVTGEIPALIGFAESQSPGVIDGFDLPFNARALAGKVDGSAVVTMTFGDDPAPLAVDYAVNGSAHDFTSAAPIADRKISNGQLTFQATPQAYHVSGTADLDGVPAELVLDGGGKTTAEIKVASTIDAADFTKFGFDISNLMTGPIRFVAKPLDNGALQIAADLTDAKLSIKDIGLSKPAGVPGTLNAEILQDGTLTQVSMIDLNFAHVRVKGDLAFDADTGLVSADFSDFALSEGDAASLSVKPGEQGGYQVSISGEQFDLKPMLKRYFALDKTSTGAPQATAVPQELAIDLKLKRALGFYSVTAYNVAVSLDLKGEDVLDASLQAQFTDGNAVSLTSNPTSGGRLMTVAYNDAGTVLRFLNVYPRLLGGSGSLTLRTDAREHVDYGEIRIKDFSIVDEAKIAEIIGNHKDSRKLIAKENRINFQNGQVTFVRRSDRIEVTDAVLDGGSIGGTLKGFVYTKARKYDLVGTYIPLFGLNNFFQKLPLIGEILGGRTGEGLVGVTFAVRGDLDKPEFVVNPVSILAPGVFRKMFEFRATEAPREQSAQ